MKRSHRSHRLPKVLLFALLCLVLLHLWPESVTLSPPSSAPAAAPAADWNRTLVNQWHGVPDGYRFTLARVQDGVKVDRRIAHDLKNMLGDAEALGYEVHLNAGYRTSAEQQALFDDKVAAFRASGYDETTARSLASQWVSPPGTSEHELGLAVDIGTETPALYDWLASESWRYGFIQRYPPDKTALTGVSHEPWHYRYIGEEAAAQLHAQGLCLEEYLSSATP